MPTLKNCWVFSVIILLLLCSFLPTPSYSQYDNTAYEYEITEYSEEPVDTDPSQQGPQIPDATLIPPPSSSTLVLENDKPTIFKLPENYSVHKSPPLLGKKYTDAQDNNSSVLNWDIL
jgi:hypothetical protein